MLGIISYIFIVLYWMCFHYLWAWGHIETLSEFLKLLILLLLVTILFVVSETAFLVLSCVIYFIGLLGCCATFRNFVIFVLALLLYPVYMLYKMLRNSNFKHNTEV
jgi:hypothetical protein